MQKMALFSRRIVPALVHTYSHQDCLAKDYQLQALTQYVPILQKMCFELNYASQFAKGYYLPAHGNYGIEIRIQPWHIVPFYAVFLGAALCQENNVYKAITDTKSSVRTTVKIKVMDFFNLMTLWYNKCNGKTNVTRAEQKGIALLVKYKPSFNSTLPNEKKHLSQKYRGIKLEIFIGILENNASILFCQGSAIIRKHSFITGKLIRCFLLSNHSFS